MDLFQFLATVFSKTDNITVVVLVCALGVSMWLHVVSRREEREDRRVLLDLVQKNTEALNGVKNVLSAMTGRPL